MEKEAELSLPELQNAPEEFQNLVEALLTKDPSNRLGFDGAEQVKQHPFFEGTDWEIIQKRQFRPHMKPHIKDDIDVSMFDPRITGDDLEESCSMIEDNTYQFVSNSVDTYGEMESRLFDGFDYYGPSQDDQTRADSGVQISIQSSISLKASSQQKQKSKFSAQMIGF